MAKGSSTKKNVTLFVDEKLYNEAKGMGIGVSRELEDLLEELIKNPGMSKEELEVRKKLRRQKQLMFQRDLLLDEIGEIEEQLKDLGMKIEEHEALAIRAQKSEERGKAIQALNQLLQRCEYDEVQAWEDLAVQGVLSELRRIDEQAWDMEMFVKHAQKLQRLKKIMRR